MSDDQTSPLTHAPERDFDLQDAFNANFSFVRPWLAGMALPGYFNSRETDTKLLTDAGITHVVSLIEADYAPDWLADSFRWSHYDVPDMFPPRPDQVKEIVESTKAVAEGGGAVMAHCFAGIGRTGTTLACCLAYVESLDAPAAVRELRKVRPESIQTRTQHHFVEQFVARFC